MLGQLLGCSAIGCKFSGLEEICWTTLDKLSFQGFPLKWGCRHPAAPIFYKTIAAF
jgi:hypothetical protein